ncbi:MAG: ATPase, T2SS/T4P/T4SS family, partial [Gammaproteobacteria bacterium]
MQNLIRETFELAKKLNASDIHLHSDQKPVLRIDGRLFPLTTERVISREQMDSTVDELLRDDQKEDFARRHQVDTAVEYEGLGVLRINVYKERGKLTMANRIIGSKVPDISDLGLPPMIHRLADIPRGLILVSGATSNGKSTTLAAIIEEINKKYQKHILTIEDPIEFVFSNKKSIFSQRDIGIDAISFSSAIVGAMRQDPDVILISDLRDPETIENALIAAETGHLVFATTHAPTAPDTITRIVATFPSEKQH